MNNQAPFTLLFDNAGGILLQTEDYCHHYNDPEQAAADVHNLIEGHDAALWDNNEPEYRTYNYDYDQDDISEILLMSYDEDRHCGFAEKEFFKLLTQNI
tara:strand:+ start:503 stop:799 length:297 start_codon:yes stop_codon:yes gene_type:complete